MKGNQMLLFTVDRTSTTLDRLFKLEPKLQRAGAAIQSWDDDRVQIAVSDETMMPVCLFLSDNSFRCRIDNNSGLVYNTPIR